MSAEQVQVRRDTAANIDSAIPADGELAWDQTNDRLRVGDGTTQGGIPHPNFKDTVNNTWSKATIDGTSTANAIVVTLAKKIGAYQANQKIQFIANATNNSSPVTFEVLEVPSLGPVTLKKVKNGALVDLDAGDILNGGAYEVHMDGTYGQLVQGASGGSELPGNWDLLAEITGGGSVYDFENFISSDYDSYVFLMTLIRPTSNNVTFCMRVKRTGQPSYDSGGTDYSSQGTTFGQGNTAGIANDPSGINGTPTLGYMQLATQVRTAANGNQGLCGEIVWPALGVSEIAPYMSDMVHLISNNSGYRYATRQLAVGHRLNGQAIVGVRFFFNSGSIDSGIIRMYGIRGE